MREYYLPRTRSESERRYSRDLDDHRWVRRVRNGEPRIARGKGSHYDNWQEPVVFEPDEAAHRPARWLKMLEKLEAQVLSRSAPAEETLSKSIPPGHTFQQLVRSLRVLRHAADNLQHMQAAHFCEGSFNILVAERARPQVARLVGIDITEVNGLVSRATRFIGSDGLVSRRHAAELLRECTGFLASVGLGFAGFEEWREPQNQLWTESRHVAEARPRDEEDEEDETQASLAYAFRTVAYVVDIGVCSFSGAHLEPFDEVYFPHRANVYTISCGATGSVIFSRRHFRCLEGFFNSHPAWVFAAHEPSRATNLDLGRELYLHTTLEQLANVWGPLWRVESRRRDGTSRFALTSGFIVASVPGDLHPRLLAHEFLCHWTKDVEAAGEAPGFPRYINVRYLLIGAAAGLDENRHCPTNPDEVSNKFRSRQCLQILSTRHGKWYWDSYNLAITITPPSSPVSFGGSLAVKRREGVTARDVILSLVGAHPLRSLGPLNEFYGVEISGCTGNARRRRLRDVLTTKTIRALVQRRCISRIDDRTWHEYATILARPDYRTRDPIRMQLFERFLRISIITLKDMKIPSASSDHVTALYACERGGYAIQLPTTRCDWLRLFSDNLESFTAPVIEANCLECERGPRLFCHHRGRRLHGNPTTSVLESAVTLSDVAPLPRGLERFPETGITDEMTRNVPAGETIDLGARGKLRVLACVRVHGGNALVVEWRGPCMRPRQTVRCFFLKAQGKMPQGNHHSERYSGSQPLSDCVPVLIVSHRNEREIVEWLDDLAK